MSDWSHFCNSLLVTCLNDLMCNLISRLQVTIFDAAFISYPVGMLVDKRILCATVKSRQCCIYPWFDGTSCLWFLWYYSVGCPISVRVTSLSSFCSVYGMNLCNWSVADGSLVKPIRLKTRHRRPITSMDAQFFFSQTKRPPPTAIAKRGSGRKIMHLRH